MNLFQRIDGLLDHLPVSPRLARFCLVGGSGVVVNLAVLSLALRGLPPAWGLWHHRLAMAVAIAVSVETNFLLNDVWTWRTSEPGGRFARNVRYILVSLLGSLLQWGVAVGLHELVMVPVLGAQGVGILVATAVNYLANSSWTFKGRG